MGQSFHPKNIGWVPMKGSGSGGLKNCLGIIPQGIGIALIFVQFVAFLNFFLKKFNPKNLMLKGAMKPLEPERAAEAREARRSGEW